MFVCSLLDAARKWHYALTTLSGQPVEVDMTTDVIFSLAGNRSPSVSSTAALAYADFRASAGNLPKGLPLLPC